MPTTVQPPPIPASAGPSLAPKPKKPFFRRPWVIVLLCLVGSVVAIVGLGVFFVLTARDFVPTDEQRAAVVTADGLAEYFDFPADPAAEEWDCSRYIDGTHDIDYYFDSEHEDAPYINCTLTIEHTSSDAAAAYVTEWQSFKIGLKTSGFDIDMVPDEGMYDWGDSSRFAFLESEGERYGFVFHGRKGSKVFFLSVGGGYWEDPVEFADFIGPYLDKFEDASF